jgi:hypothetical protein
MRHIARLAAAEMKIRKRAATVVEAVEGSRSCMTVGAVGAAAVGGKAAADRRYTGWLQEMAQSSVEAGKVVALEE